MGWSLVEPNRGWSKYVDDKHPDDILLGYEYEVDVNTAGKAPFWNNRVCVNPNNPLPWCPLPQEYRWHYEGMNKHTGIEICSAVMPLREHRKVVKGFLNSEIPFNRQQSGRLNGGGIHVSVDNAGPAKTVKDKVFKLLHVGLTEQELLRISKRGAESLRMWTRQFGDYKNVGSHYGVINNENYDRYEFRLFAAHPDLLMPALEMADSLFCGAMVSSPEFTLDEYRQYIDNKLRYRNIRNHLNEVL